MYLINNDHPSHTVAQITSVIPVTLVTPVTSVTPATPLTLSLQHVTSLKIQIKRFALFTTPVLLFLSTTVFEEC